MISLWAALDLLADQERLLIPLIVDTYPPNDLPFWAGFPVSFLVIPPLDSFVSFSLGGMPPARSLAQPSGRPTPVIRRLSCDQDLNRLISLSFDRQAQSCL